MMINAPIKMLALVAAIGFSAAPAVAQDAAAGQKKAAMCLGCHNIPGYQSSFPQVHKVPMLNGQNGKYIVAALNAYKKGERKHPTMRAIAASLTDQDMADLGAFYEQTRSPALKSVAAKEPPAEVAALLAKGACASCHGVDYNKAIDPSYPKLAGQHADYLNVALQAYATEGNPQIGRANAIMGAQVKQFKRSELKQIADYLATLPGDVHLVRESRFR